MANYILTGNANTGKTTLFNILTASREHTGNWHGVTVNEKIKTKNENTFVDLPGLYSINNAFGLEEENAIRYLTQHKTDIVLNVCDANNLQRNLFLTLQLISAGYKVCLLINFIDDLKKSNKEIDFNKLSSILGVSVIAVNLKNKKNILKNLSNLHFEQKNFNFNSEEDIYKKIDEICNLCVKNNGNFGLTKLDKFFLNKWLSLPLFLLIMLAIFYLTFSSVGKFFSDEIRQLFVNIANSSNFLNITLKQSNIVVYSFINDCLLNGVTNVLCFLPQIIMLHFCLNILEESGYISRLAFLLEDFLNRLGLSGKSVFTLLMGFGCSASAISTSSNLTNKKARDKLVMLTPNISCSAKLPIYLVIGSVFFGAKNIFVIMGLYLLGVVILIIQAIILNKIIKTEETFILEFPKLRLPKLKNVISNCLKTALNFMLKVGSTILLFSAIIWFLEHFTTKLQFTFDISNSMLKTISSVLTPLFMPLGFNSWGIVACLFSGLVAKEMVLSSICLLNGVGIDNIALTLSNGVVNFNTHTALIFLIFCLIYTPCMSTYAVQKNISGRKVALLSMFLQFVTAYIVCMLISTMMHLLKFWQTFIVLLLFVIISIIVFCYKKKKTICNGNCSNCTSCKIK